MSATQEWTPAPLAFLDTETDGVHPGRKVWEVAVIRREPDGRETEWHTFVDLDLTTADPFGLRVGRFYDRHPLGRKLSGQDDVPDWAGSAKPRSMPPALAAQKVAAMTHGAHLVGAVPNFDAEALDWLMREHGLIPGWHYHLVDVEALAVGFIAGGAARLNDEAHEHGDTPPVGSFRRAAPPWRSDELTAALGLAPVPDDERHTALGDARWAQRIYDRVMNPDLIQES